MSNVNNIKIKFNEIKFDLKNLKELTILVGKNGTGKSLVNKITWFINIVNATYHSSTLLKIDNINEVIIDILRKTFYDAATLHLEIEAEFETGNIELVIKDLNVESLNVTTKEKDIVVPLYLSSNTRLFPAIQQILKNDILLSGGYIDVEDVDVPLYDILYSVRLKEAFEKQDYVPFREDCIEMLKEHYELDFVAMQCRNNVFYIKDSTGKESQLSRLSNGEQALINMMSLNII